MRETLEEVHLRVSVTGILDVYSYTGTETVLVVYSADVVGGELADGRGGRGREGLRPGADPLGRPGVREHARRAQGLPAPLLPARPHPALALP